MASVVYLDHAATTPVRPEARIAMEPFLGSVFGNPSGSHAVARAAKTALEAAREGIATDLGAAPGEVVITSGGTEADNLAVMGAGRAAARAGRRRVVISAIEHKAVSAAAHALGADGLEVAAVGVGRDGVLDLDALEDALDDSVGVVSVMAVNNEVGTIQPLDAIAERVRQRAPAAVLHTDAVQAVPWLDVARSTQVADLVSVSAHKFGGPKGTGALVVRGGVEIEPHAVGGGQERGLRSGTVDVAGAVGMAAALRATTAGRDADVHRVAALRDRLAVGLARAPGVTPTGDRTRVVAGNHHIRVDGVSAETLLIALDRAGVCAAAGSSCASGALEPSPVLAAMGLPPNAARECVRFSLGYASTAADVERALEVVPVTIARLLGARAPVPTVVG